jgi:hypothetical protein
MALADGVTREEGRRSAARAENGFDGYRLAGALDHDLDLVAGFMDSQCLGKVLDIPYLFFRELDNYVALAQAGARCWAASRDAG